MSGPFTPRFLAPTTMMPVYLGHPLSADARPGKAKTFAAPKDNSATSATKAT